MKHQFYELRQKQALPLKDKIVLTKKRIREWYEFWNGEVFVSISGKDSTVLLDIVRSIYPDVPAVFVDTGLEYPEVRELAISHDNTIVLRPKKPFWQVVRDYGYPLISKETSECLANARKYLAGGGEKYISHYNKLMGLGEYARKSKDDIGNIHKKEFP